MDILIDETLDGKTVKEVLTNTLGYSANMIKKLKFSENGILVNGSFVTVRHTLEIGERLSLSVEDKSEDVSPYTIPVNIPIEIIFEDVCENEISPASIFDFADPECRKAKMIEAYMKLKQELIEDGML